MSPLFSLLILSPLFVASTWAAIEPVTRQQFEDAFEGAEEKRFFRTVLSSAQLFARDGQHRPESRRLVSVQRCLVFLREYGRAVVVKQCVKKLREMPLVDKRMQNFYLVYRCFSGSADNAYNYELHSAGVDKITYTPDGWMLSFRPQEAYHCRVRWTIEESVQSTMNYLKDQGLVRQGKTAAEEEAGDEPLRRDRYEEAFDRLKREFHTFPFFTFLFTRDLRTANREWTEVQECFVNLGAYGRGLITSRCARLIRLYERIDPAMPNLVIALRCFKSDNPYDYELQTAPILMVAQEDDNAPNAVLVFQPSIVEHCSIKYLGKRSIDTLLFANYLNDTDSVESARIDGADPLTREQFETSFPLSEGFQSRPYLTYVFVRDLETMALQLMPIRKCLVLLYAPGKGIITPTCAEILWHYQQIDKSLPNLVHLPYRCFLNKSPEEYELQSAAISKITMESGQYVLRFRPKEALHCAPIWAQDYHHRPDIDELSPPGKIVVFESGHEEL